MRERASECAEAARCLCMCVCMRETAPLDARCERRPSMRAAALDSQAMQCAEAARCLLMRAAPIEAQQ
jgi:hypothetical protein